MQVTQGVSTAGQLWMEPLNAASNSITFCCSGFSLQGGSCPVKLVQVSTVVDYKLLRDDLPFDLQGIEHMAKARFLLSVSYQGLPLEAVCALAHCPQLLPQCSQGKYSSKAVKSVFESLSKCRTCFLFFQSYPIARKFAPYPRVLA